MTTEKTECPNTLSDRFEEVQLVYYNKTRAKDRPQIKSSQQAYDALMSIWDMGQIALAEEFNILLLDRHLRLMSYCNLARGGTDGVLIDIRLAFATALKRRASSMILAHNHPSGNVEPSKDDIRLTKKFVEAGHILNISINDHLIVTPDSSYSMASNGIL